MNLLRRKNLPGVHLPGVQDFSAQRKDGLVRPVAALLGGATGGIAFHQEQFGAGDILAGTVRQLAGQAGNVPAVTGAAGARVLGGIYPA